jgi:glycosyltransferase involved in cell wall biosynthesis
VEGSGAAVRPGAASSKRVAIVHERFTEMGGSEHVVEQFHQIWPDAPVFVPIADRAVLPRGLLDADIRTSALQQIYRRGHAYAHLLPMLPWAMTHFDLSDFDLVVTSHHAFSNRVRPPVDVPVISYTHTPARWMWQPEMRSSEWGGSAARSALGVFAASQRRYDRAAASRLRGVVSNSRHVARRVQTWWSRDAWVVPPPVDTKYYTPGPSIERDDFFLLAGRLVPYKRPDIAIEAAKRANVRLVVAGEGRARAAIEPLAGPRTEFVGRVDDAALRDLYRRCRALLFPGEEDFGIVPVEAMACGAPVIAPAVGGVLDTVLPGISGTLYAPDADAVPTLASVLENFDERAFDRAALRSHAERFAPTCFRAAFEQAVDAILRDATPPDVDSGFQDIGSPLRGPDTHV